MAEPEQSVPLPGRDEPPQALVAWAGVVDVSGLSDRTARQARSYLRHYRHMNWFGGREGAFRLMAAISEQVSPPPPISLQPLDVIGTVLRLQEQPGQSAGGG